MLSKIVVFIVFLLSQQLYSQCIPPLGLKNGSDGLESSTKVTEYALAVISDPEHLAHQSQCVVAAIHYLGEARVEAAVPQLVRRVGYAVSTPQCEGRGTIVGGIGTGCGPKGPFREAKYPALGALHRIGKPAAKSLVQALATVEPDSIDSNNALYAFMDIYREDINGALRILKAAALQESKSGAARLENALQRARNDWCLNQRGCEE